MWRSLSLSALSAATLGAAFVFQWWILHQLGASRETDALFAAIAIPQLVLAVVSSSLMHVVVPAVASAQSERRAVIAWTFVLGTGAVFAVAALILGLSAPLWVPALFPGFSDPGPVVLLLRIQLLTMIPTATSAMLLGASHAQDRFVMPELSQLIAALAAIAVLPAALAAAGVTGAAWTSLGRSLLQTALLLPLVGLPLRLTGARRVARDAWLSLRPLLAGSMLYKADPLVDRSLASLAPSGELSILHLAQQIVTAGVQVVNNGFAAPVVPALALDWVAGDRAAFSRRLFRAVVTIGILIGAGLLVLVAAGRPLLNLAFTSGRLTAGDASLLWILLLAFAGVALFGAAGQITAGSFYASGDTSTPVRIGVLTFLVYLPLKVIAFMRFGVLGLALSASVFAIVNTAAQGFIMRRRLHP